MDNKKALQIAHEFLMEMNPDMWNGRGKKPNSLDERIYEPDEKLGKLHLEITFVESDEYYEEDTGWYTYVDLVDGGTSVECSSCYGTDSTQNIADCILEVCKWGGID